MEQLALFPIQSSEFIKQVADAVSARLKADAHSNPPTEAANNNLTQEEACKLMNVCRATIIKWQNTGIISYRKVGRRTYYSRKELLSINQNNYASGK